MSVILQGCRFSFTSVNSELFFSTFPTWCTNPCVTWKEGKNKCMGPGVGIKQQVIKFENSTYILQINC